MGGALLGTFFRGRLCLTQRESSCMRWGRARPRPCRCSLSRVQAIRGRAVHRPASWDQACSRCQGAVGDGAGPGFNPMNNINHAIMAGCTLAVIEACQSDMYAQASTESLCMITNGVVGEFNWTSSADFNYARLNECAPHSAPLSRPAFPFSLAHAHTHSPKTHDPMHGRANVHLCAAGLRLSRR